MNRTRLIFVGIIVAALVIVGVSLVLRGQSGGGAPAALTVERPDAATVRVLTALPVEPWVRSAAADFNAADVSVDGVPIQVEIIAADGLTALGRWDRNEYGALGLDFNSTGDLLATASIDRTVKLWDVATGEPFGDPLQGHTYPVVNVAFSPDGKRMVAQIEKERRVVLWDLSGAGSVRAVKKLTAYMNMRRVVFSADSRRMVGVSHRGLAWLWNADSGDILARLSPRSRVKVVAFSPDSRRVAVAGRDSFVRVYNAGDGKLVCKLPLFTVAQWVGFSPDGRSLLTVTTSPPYRLVGGGGDATLWRLADGVVERRFADVGAVDAVFFAAEGRRLATHNQDGGAGLWSTRTGTRIADLAAASPVTALRVSGDGTLVAVGHEDGQVRVWSAQQATQLAAVTGGGEIADVAIGAGNRRLLAVCRDAGDAWRLRWWRLHRGQATLIRDEALPQA